MSFITHIDPTKTQESINPRGTLPEPTFFCPSETALLDLFLLKFNELDPDVIIAHDLYSSVFEILMSRLKDKGIKKSTLLSRLANVGSSEIPKYGFASSKVRTVTKGRLILDSLLAAQEFVSSVEYTLESLSKKILNQEM
jgi:DNA polymerase elongation subunit (family B)